MPSAVLDVEWTRLPEELRGLERYEAALILVRIQGQPVGQVRVPIADGRIDGRKLHGIFLKTAGSAYRKLRVARYVGWQNQPSAEIPAQPATVAVCTRDRPEDLLRCLQGLARLPDDGQEVLVVDNCPSTEDTQSIVRSFVHVRYVREDIPGLNVARNRAFREARHDIVAFTDDDVVTDPGWLRALVRNFNNHPLLMCVTGLTMPLELETPAQEAFESYSPFGRGFERRLFRSDRHNPLAAGAIGAGANMALRRNVLQEVGPFDEALDAGTPTHSGGDHEMFSRILLRGYRIVYEPSALSWHRHRRSSRDLRLTVYGYGVGAYAAWMRALLVEGEMDVFRAAIESMRHNQLPALYRSLLRRPGCKPLHLIIVELYGCAVGPWAYLASRRQMRARSG